jgi:hypothetical protein
MMTINNQTNYIEFIVGSGKDTVVKSQIVDLKLKSGHILLVKVTGAPIKILFDEVSSPVCTDLSDLFETIKGYL